MRGITNDEEEKEKKGRRERGTGRQFVSTSDLAHFGALEDACRSTELSVSTDESSPDTLRRVPQGQGGEKVTRTTFFVSFSSSFNFSFTIDTKSAGTRLARIETERERWETRTRRYEGDLPLLEGR